MEFGKVDPKELSHINFKLPGDGEFTINTLEKSKSKSIEIHIGCAKWGRKEWVGKIYPPKTKEKDFLTFYARNFDCIELNALFYNIQTDKVIKEWKDKTGKNFLFCPKLNQGVTHIKRLSNVDEILDRYLACIYSFGDKLGPVFIQLPDSFGPKNIDRIDPFLKKLPKDLTFFFEVRHPDWYKNEFATDYFSILKKNKVGTVITDASGRRDCVHMQLTSPEAFIRFVGNGLHKTDYTRIDDWIARIKKWKENGIKKVYFFMHQHEELHSPELCKYLIENINKKLGVKIKPPVFFDNNSQKLF